MFGRTPKIPLDIEMGVTLMDQEPESYQNYAKKLQARLKWAYQKAQRIIEKKLNNKRSIITKNEVYESEARWFGFSACKGHIWIPQNYRLMGRQTISSSKPT